MLSPLTVSVNCSLAGITSDVPCLAARIQASSQEPGAEHNTELRLSTSWTKPAGCWSRSQSEPWLSSCELRLNSTWVHTRIFAKHFGFLEVKFDSNSFKFSDIILPRYYNIIVVFFSLTYYQARSRKCWIYLKITKKILHLPPYLKSHFRIYENGFFIWKIDILITFLSKYTIQYF